MGSSCLAVTAESKAHTKKGIALYNQGKVSEAVAEFKLAIAIDPKNADYHRNLSAVYQSVGNLEGAATEGEAAIKCAPNDAKSVENLANIYMSGKKYSLAEKYYRQALKLAPGTSDYHNNLALCLKAQNKDYLPELNQGLKGKPNDVDAHVLLSRTFLESKKTAEAESEARTAVKYGAKIAEAHLALANVLKVRGKDKEAVAEYQTALVLKPNHQLAAEIKKTIEYLKNKVDARIP